MTAGITKGSLPHDALCALGHSASSGSHLALLGLLGGQAMRTILSYCTAKPFRTGLLPMAAMIPHHVAAQNDNHERIPFPGVWG
jgi:hypothetical protein